MSGLFPELTGVSACKALATKISRFYFLKLLKFFNYGVDRILGIKISIQRDKCLLNSICETTSEQNLTKSIYNVAVHS